MPYKDLRDWLNQVDAMGELRKIEGATLDEDVGRITEMLQHTDDAPAALFSGFSGYPPGFRILVNGLSKRSRIALTLGLPIDIGPFELMDQWMELNTDVQAIPVKVVEDGPVLENVMTGDDVDVTIFPTPLWHELDGGRYIGTGCVNVIKDPDSDWINLGTYRGMIQDKSKVGIYISPGKHGRIFRDKYFERGEKMPIAMVVGGDPLLFVSSSLELPVGMSEYEFAGAVRGEPFEVIRGRYTGLPIPAQAEIVIEGLVDPEARMEEGPFGEWTGYYASSQRPEPFIDIKAIYYRNDPILLGIPPQKPPYEAHRYRVYLRSAMLHKALKDAGVPDVTAVWCHGVGGCRLLNVVAIKQRYPGHARQAGHVAAMCRVGAYLGRLVIVVDDDIDVTDLGDVMWAVCTRSDPSRSLDLIQRAWSGPLDPAIPPGEKGFNSRLIIDACRPWEWRDEFPPAIGPSLEVKRATREKWGHLLK